MHQKNALVAAPISLARSMREQREIAWAMSTIRCKSFCQPVKGRPDNVGLNIEQRRNNELHCAAFKKPAHPCLSPLYL